MVPYLNESKSHDYIIFKHFSLNCDGDLFGKVSRFNLFVHVYEFKTKSISFTNYPSFANLLP